MNSELSFESKLTALKGYWSEKVVGDLRKGVRTDFETAMNEVANEQRPELLIQLWMTIFTGALLEDGLTESDKRTLIEWVFTKVPWFDTKTPQFANLKKLEAFAFNSVNLDFNYLRKYAELLSKHLAPHELGPGIDKLLESQPIELCGKRFESQSALLAYIEQEILADHVHTNELIEITNEHHRELLAEVFKHGVENLNKGSVQKILYGPHPGVGGAYRCFQVVRQISVQSAIEEANRVTGEAGRVFAIPPRRVPDREVVSYVDSVRKLFAEVMFYREQGYIQSVNGVYFPSYFAAVECLLRKYPLQQLEYLDGVIKNFPHHRSDKLVLTCSVRNILSLAVLYPNFEQKTLDFVLSLLVRLDCEAGLGRSFIKEKLDELLEIFILYINFKLDITSESTSAVLGKPKDEIWKLEGVHMLLQRPGGGRKLNAMQKENFIHLLLQKFGERILKVEKPAVVQFIYYYISCLSGDYDWIKEAYLEQLIINLLDKRLQRQAKLHSLYYLFSFLRSSTEVTPLILHTALTYLINYLTSNYSKYIKRNPQIAIRKLSSEEVQREQVRRTASTENTNPIGDDIFVFCYQSCIDLFVLKQHQLTKEQKEDLTGKLDQLTEKTLDFITYSVAESETFFILFRRLKEILEDSITKNVLDDLLGFATAPITSKFISPRGKAHFSPLGTGKPIRFRNIDYIPFRPVSMRFYDKYISPHIHPVWGSESIGDRPVSPFDSLSRVDTSATEYCRPFSPLGKRPLPEPIEWSDDLPGQGIKKLST